MTDNNSARLSEYIRLILPKVEKSASGSLHYPFLAISYGKFYADAVFSWDNYHMAMRLAAAGKPEYFRYHLDNLLEYQREDGLVPCVVTAAEGPWFPDPVFPAQPFVLQGALQYWHRSGDPEWLRSRWPQLVKHLQYWEANSFDAAFGLFYWPAGWMGGFDNDPATSFCGLNAVMSPDINSWFVMEYDCAAALAEALHEDAATYRRKAAQLRTRINEQLWLESESSYASWHRAKNVPVFSWGDLSGDRTLGYAAFQSCSNLIPLYARVAPEARARRMITRYVLAEEFFWSPWGLRSLAKCSNYYNNAVWGNPPRFDRMESYTNSNWQGPVWFPICYFGFHGLRYYGFREEAAELMRRTQALLCKSLDTMGSFAENYDAEDGHPLYCTDFASWNLLADLMPAELDGPAVMDPVWNAKK